MCGTIALCFPRAGTITGRQNDSVTRSTNALVSNGACNLPIGQMSPGPRTLEKKAGRRPHIRPGLIQAPPSPLPPGVCAKPHEPRTPTEKLEG